jgi:hypothetical protein
LRVELALLEASLRGEHLGGLGLLDGGGAHDAADEGGEEGGRRGFAADVAEDDGGAVGAVVDEVVEVAADGAGGEKADGHFGVGCGGRGGRQQAELDLAGHGDVALELRFLAADGLVEAGVFNGDGHLAASVVSMRSCSSLKKPVRVCSRSSTPMMRPL